MKTNPVQTVTFWCSAICLVIAFIALVTGWPYVSGIFAIAGGANLLVGLKLKGY